MIVSTATETFHASSNVISDIKAAPVVFFDKQKGIVLSFTIQSYTLKQLDKQIDINLDSIVLQTTANKLMVINSPFNDSVYWNDTGHLTYVVLYRLSDNEIAFLKKETITNLQLMVNNRFVDNNLARKTQSKMREFFLKNY